MDLPAPRRPIERDALAPLRGRVAELLQQVLAYGAQPGRRQPLQELQDQRKLDRLAVFLPQQIRDGQVQGLRDLAQQQHRDVALAGLELRQIALGYARIPGQDLARHAALGAHFAHPLAEGSQERRLDLGGGVGCLRAGRRRLRPGPR